MSKRTPKPVTPAAKADASTTSKYRRVYPQWDDDAARFGVRAADYNAGFISGANNEARKHRKR